MDCIGIMRKVMPSQDETSTDQLHSLEHGQEILIGLNNLRKSGLLCDVVFECDNVKVSAHRSVLASGSKYFLAMFTGGMSETRSPVIQIEGIKGNVFEQLVEYVYTGDLIITDNDVQDMFAAANLLQMIRIKTFCRNYIISRINLSNCISTKRLAVIYDCPDLINVCSHFIQRHFSDLMKDGSFSFLTKSELIEIIRDDYLEATEEIIFDAVVQWVAYDKDNREHVASDLCKFVRFKHLSHERLTEYIHSDEFMTNNFWCREHLYRALSNNMLPVEKQIQTKTRDPSRSLARAGVFDSKINNAPVLLVLGDNSSLVEKIDMPMRCCDAPHMQELMTDLQLPDCGGSTAVCNSDSTQREEPEIDTNSILDMPRKRYGFAVAVVNDYIYVIGGMIGKYHCRSVDVLDPTHNVWHSGPQMLKDRQNFAVAVHECDIYILGGLVKRYLGAAIPMADCEKLNVSIGEWRRMTPMSANRCMFGAAFLDGKLYAVGGPDVNGQTVECLDPANRKWSCAPDLLCARVGHSVCELNNKIYAVGGHGIMSHDAEVFSLEVGIWQGIAFMYLCRKSSGLVAHNGCLYVVGGQIDCGNTDVIEIYAPETDIWTVHPTRLREKRGAVCAAIVGMTR